MYTFAPSALPLLRRGRLSLAGRLRRPPGRLPIGAGSRRAASMSGGAGLPVGFIGLGVMGLPMAANIANSGTGDVLAWNRSPARFDELARLTADGPRRAAWADSARDVVARSGITFAMLSTPAAAHAVLRAGGALDALAPGKMLVDCSTLTVGDMQGTAAAAHARGAAFLEAPVSGSKGPAAAGSLIFLCAGERAVYDAAAPAFAAMGKRAFFLGEAVGAGTRMKLIVNQIMSSTLAALAEGIALSEASGIAVPDLLEVLELGATGNSMFSLKGPKMTAERRDYEVNFPLEHALKDMDFAQQLGAERGVDMAVSAAATKWFKEANDMGLGREDFSAVMESVRAAAMKAAMK